MHIFRYVLANDLSPSAVAAMQRNVEINGLAGGSTSSEQASADPSASSVQQPKVRINEGDAWCAELFSQLSLPNFQDEVR